MAWQVKALARIPKAHIEVERTGSTKLSSDLQGALWWQACVHTHVHKHVQIEKINTKYFIKTFASQEWNFKSH